MVHEIIFILDLTWNRWLRPLQLLLHQQCLKIARKSLILQHCERSHFLLLWPCQNSPHHIKKHGNWNETILVIFKHCAFISSRNLNMKSRFWLLKSASCISKVWRWLSGSPASCECCLAFPKVWWEDIHLWVDRSPRDRIDNLQIKWQWVTEVNFVEWCWQKPVLPCFSCAKTCWGSLWSYPSRAKYEYHGLAHTEKKSKIHE